ncbi:uncharacterized protein LOC119583528 isoform X2 [Penaeus monodon]|uniref:uncharacterized protein LOC119583528 isoform X2 n=1 Tax=Penaeus monodon TaxID=6687 RepID=UPI0018A7C55C|nr:uncharacterized protein LOC119583528 isoform X2 [Penaeus monodon]
MIFFPLFFYLPFVVASCGDSEFNGTDAEILRIMRPRTNWSCVWAVVVAWAFASQLNGEAAEDVLFKSAEAKDEVPVTLRMEDPKTGLAKSMVLHVRRAMLDRYHVTKEEVEAARVDPDAKGDFGTLWIGGIPFNLSVTADYRQVIDVRDTYGEPAYKIDFQNFEHMTMRDIENDPTLVPEPPETIEWSVPGRRPLTSLALNISARAVVVTVNKAREVSKRTAATGVPEQLWLAGAGLHLLVLNPCTAEVTLDKVFPTGEPGAHRELTWTLANIQDNRVVVVASVHDGSLQLLSSARERLEALGSEWVRYYSFRDSWAWVFVMGGATLGSGFAPNTGAIDKSASPLLMEVDVPWGPSRDGTKGDSAGKKAGHDGIKDDKAENDSHAKDKHNENDLANGQKKDQVPSGVPVTISEYLTRRRARITKERKAEAENSDVREAASSEAAAEASCAEICPSWPPTQEWQRRRAFCAAHDGFGELCDCGRPFVVNREDAVPKPTTWREDIPILIITGGRVHYLFRLLQSLGKQPGVRRDLILLVTDGYNTEVAKIAHILCLTLLVHRPEGVIPAKISRNVRFGLFNIIKQFPKADKFIMLEDDLILSPDFYSYMQQTSWILENDPSVYCVSAFNHLSYTHTAYNATQIYRAHSYPAYGWMMDKKGLEFILPKWLPSNVTHDWDHFMDTGILRRGRECIIPDINRSYHGGSVGAHLTASWATEKDFLNRTYNLDPEVVLADPSRLLQKEYEREMKSLLARAEVVDTDQLDDTNFTFSVKEGGVHVIYAYKETPEDDLAFRVLGDVLGIWNRDDRDAHHHTWRLHYKGATLLVVGVPFSPYSSYRRRGMSVFGVLPESKADLEREDQRVRLGVLLSTHANMTNLPFHDAPAQLIPAGNALFLYQAQKRRKSTSSGGSSSPSSGVENEDASKTLGEGRTLSPTDVSQEEPSGDAESSGFTGELGISVGGSPSTMAAEEQTATSEVTDTGITPVKASKYDKTLTKVQTSASR